jgi:hypothetical protein
MNSTTATKLNLEAGNLPTWTDEQAQRLSKLKTFQPKGWTAVGFAKAIKGLKTELRKAGLTGSWLDNTVGDIIDMARLYALAT